MEDLETFRAVRIKALTESPEAFGTTLERALQRDLESWRIQLESTVAGNQRNTQLAFAGLDCVGLAALYEKQNIPREGEILMMWVAPRQRGTGIAKGLLENLLDWSRETEFNRVTLAVTESNQRAIQFYKTFGFSEFGGKVEIDTDRNLYGIEMECLIH